MAAFAAVDGEALWHSAALQPARSAARGRFRQNAEMGKLTWFRAGGLAELLYQPADEADLAQFLALLPQTVAVTVVGIGSNLLVRDGGIKGVVLRLPPKAFGAIERVGKTQLRAGAATSDKALALAALKAGLGGFHFLHGIPGSIGGAISMNAGANGAEIADVLTEAYAVDRAGKKLCIKRAAMGFGYRQALAAKGLIFTAALLRGIKADKAFIAAAQQAVENHRNAAQPVREKTGGSTFRNPEGQTAWKLIDAAGCRGATSGGAQISPLHCNFMINNGTASAYDLESLGEEVRCRVFATSGIKLQWEIKRLGQFLPGKAVKPAF